VNPQGLAEPVTPRGTWAQWLEAGFDRESIVGDPRFVDAENDDYRLKDDSPALKLARIIHEQKKWDRHLACLSWLTGWKPIPRVDE